MPRNEFMNHDDDMEFDLQVVRDGDGNPIDIIKVPRDHPGKGEEEAPVEPVEADHQHSLRELRRESGATTTEAHIAEINAKSAATD